MLQLLWMTPSLPVFAGATAVLLLAIASGIPWPARRTLAHPAVLGAVALFLASVAVRELCVRPTLVHADVVAPELLDCILQFPAPCTTRGASYGQYGFLLLGALTHLFGNDLSAVFRAMGIVGAMDVALLAVLAHRLSGSPWGGLLAVAVVGTNPAFMRVAGSEDMHNVGLLVALIALIAMDVFAVTRRTAPLIAAALALSLLVHTRQTFQLFAPCAFLLAVARAGGGLLADRRFWTAAVGVAAVLVSRVVTNAASGGLVQQMAMILGEPVLLPTILRHHAALDVARFGPLPVLTVAAFLWACFGSRLAQATASMFFLNFIATYPPGMPSPGVELAQRLPVLALGALLVAMAGAAALESRRGHGVVAGLCAGIALIAAPPFFPGWRMIGALTPVHQEYLAVESAATALPADFTLVKLPTAESTVHGHARYEGLLERLGKRVRVVPATEIASAPRPWIFLEDIECWTYGFRELTGATDDKPTGRMREFRWDLVLFGRAPSPLRPPEGARPECRGLLARAGTPIGPGQVITDPPDDPPFLFYSSRSVQIQFHQLATVPSAAPG